MPSSQVMHKYKHGQLHSGSKHGPKVKNRKQAIAIMLSEKKKEEEGDYHKSVEPELWLLSKAGDFGDTGGKLKRMHVTHRESMSRKVGAASKVLEHHGYKPGIKKEQHLGGTFEPSGGDASGKNGPRHSDEQHSQIYHHPKTGQTVQVHAQKPYTFGGEVGNRSKIPRKGLEANIHGQIPHTNKPLHHLDSHLSETHGTEPYSRKLRRSLQKSQNCPFCQGKGMIKVIFKSDGMEEKNFRLCPQCQSKE